MLLLDPDAEPVPLPEPDPLPDDLQALLMLPEQESEQASNGEDELPLLELVLLPLGEALPDPGRLAPEAELEEPEPHPDPLALG